MKIEDALAGLVAQVRVQTWLIVSFGIILAAIGLAKLFMEG